MHTTGNAKSQLIRLLLWVVIVCALIAAILLVYEAYSYTQTMPDRGLNIHVFRLIVLVLANLLFTAVLAIVFVLYLWGRLARSLPDLQGWHTDRPESEFTSADARPGYTLDDYLKQEDRVFAELDEFVSGPWATQMPGAYSRYHADSICNPETIVDRNWNRSLVLKAANPIGGVLLLHGLSDSPYSLRALGNKLHAEGYTVVWLRLPGHGTNPRALAEVSWRDWTAAVQIAVRGLSEMLPKDVPLILAGYSNGGALSVDYTLSTLENSSLRRPDAVVLFSPMIGVSRMAEITRVYHMVSRVTGNEKAQWSAIDAEIDPFKYSSWPMNANVQAWAMTKSVERRLSRAEKAGQLHLLPPMLAMQSVVDSTVIVPMLISVLFDRLRSDQSELVLFDINRFDFFGNLLNLSFENNVVPKLKRDDLPYRLTLLRNKQTDSEEVCIQTRDGQTWTERESGMSWPDRVVSLSHVAVPIPPNDPIYGTADATNGSGLPLGSLSMRAEPSALLIPNSMFIRCRNNPFYTFMEGRVIDWLSEVNGNHQDAEESLWFVVLLLPETHMRTRS